MNPEPKYPDPSGQWDTSYIGTVDGVDLFVDSSPITSHPFAYVADTRHGWFRGLTGVPLDKVYEEPRAISPIACEWIRAYPLLTGMSRPPDPDEFI